MKHIKYKLTMIWIISLLIAYSCNINDEQDGLQLTLPPITQTGANTFGCYVDGKLLIPRDGTGTIGGPDRAAILWGDPSGNQQYTELDIADFKSDRTGKILIHIQNLNSNG